MAAYIDRTLSKAESARITEHLASCEDCYTIYMETLDFQLEPSQREEPQGGANAEVVQFRRPEPAQPTAQVAQEAVLAAGSRRSPARWLPLAALLLIGIGSGSYLAYFQLLALPNLKTTPATPPIASLPPVEQGSSPLWLGPTPRGGGNQEEIGIDEASFRMGVQTVNLQATLQAGQVRESEDIVARILQVLEPQAFMKDLYDRYAGITAALEKKRSPAELLPEAARLAQESESQGLFDIPSHDLGQWVEAGRLAAMARKPSFFQQSDNQRFLRRLLWNDKLGLRDDVKLDPTTRASLDRVSEILSRGDLRPSDYAEMQHELEKILNTYYPMT